MKEIAKFTTKSTSIEVSQQPGGALSFTLNLEGSVTGAFEGAILMTIHATSSDLKSGSYTHVVAGYLSDGSTTSVSGGGTLQSVGGGGHKWRLRGSDITADGLTVVTDGEMDLATRTYVGTIYE
ncbi:MAG: hypothetical protein ACI9BW_000206 [Gammaproteobacteria bacterium]|jgi:hypothetical protein